MGIGKYLSDPALVVKKLQWQALYRGARRDVTLDTTNGRLTFDSRDKLIGKQLFMNGGYEIEHVERALGLLREGGHLPSAGQGTVLDVGANIGMICIAMLRAGHFRRALAFEPGPDNYRLLAHNVAQNGLADRVTCLPVALSSAEGEMPLELSDYNSGDHRIRYSARAGAFDEDRRATITVRVKTLDGVLSELPPAVVPDIGLVWMDIQGHEGRFFQGARGFLLSRPIAVVTEFWPYGILRSGMSRAEYGRVVGELFTHFYEWSAGGFVRRPIGELDVLFDSFSASKQVSEVLLVRNA